MWDDTWILKKVTNLSDKSITLKRKSKLADMSRHVAVEDLRLSNVSINLKSPIRREQTKTMTTHLLAAMVNLGRADIDILIKQEKRD